MSKISKTFAAFVLAVLVIAGFTVSSASATAPAQFKGWVTWSAPTFIPGLNGKGDANDIGWPQSLVGKGKIAPTCGQTVQQDYYEGLLSDVEAILADGKLTRSENGSVEDSVVVKDWLFVSGKYCPVEITPQFPEPTPPTCTSDGSFDFSGEAAENANGVERDGYHLYVSPAPGSGPGEYTFTAYKIGGAGNAAYPGGTKLVGETKKTITVLPKLNPNDVADCRGDKPEAKVETTDWVSGTPACGDTTVVQTRNVLTTDWVWGDGDWVLTDSVTTHETRTVDLELSQVIKCPVDEPTPTPTPTPSDTPTPTPTPSDTPTPTPTPTPSDTPSVTPTPEPSDTPTSTPTPTWTPKPPIVVTHVIPPVEPPEGPELAETGVNGNAIGILAAIFLLAGGSLVLIRKRARKL